MLCSYAYCVPTSNSLHQLKNIFDGAPFEIDWSRLQVEIFISSEDLDPNIAAPNLVFKAQPVKMDLWMNLLLGGSSLIISLDSPDLVNRNMQYSKYFGAAFTTNYYPHLTVLQQAPQLKRNVTGFLSNATSILIENQLVLDFSAESIVHIDFKAQPDAGFNEAMTLGQDGDSF